MIFTSLIFNSLFLSIIKTLFFLKIDLLGNLQTLSIPLVMIVAFTYMPLYKEFSSISIDVNTEIF